MHIRLARPADAAAVHAIYAPIVRDTVISFELEPPAEEVLAERIRSGVQRHPWVVGEEAGVVVGYAYGAAHRERSAYAWSAEVSVYVAPSHRRRGLASRLYRVTLALLEDLGFHRALAGIALPNPASVSFHESMGFRHVGTYSEVGYKFGHWHDVGWWEASLHGTASSGTASSGPPRRASERHGSDTWRRHLEENAS